MFCQMYTCIHEYTKNHPNNYHIIISLPFGQIGHHTIMYIPRISPPNTVISRSITHMLFLIPPYLGCHHMIQIPPGQPVSHRILLPISRHEHDTHLTLPARHRQMDLFGAPPGLEPDLLGPRQQVLCPGQRVLVVVLVLRVDLGLGPSEDPELKFGPEVDKRE